MLFNVFNEVSTISNAMAFFTKNLFIMAFNVTKGRKFQDFCYNGKSSQLQFYHLMK